MVRLTERSVEELIVFMLGTTLFVGLVLIAMMRYSADQPGIASADAIGAMVTLALLVHVYLTRRVKLASTLIPIGTVLGVMTIVLLNGSEEIYFLYPAIIAGFFLLTPNLAMMVGVIAVAILAPVLFAQMEIFELLKFVFSILGCILFAYTFSVIRERQRDQLLGLATKDPLTGTGNRRALLEKMDEMMLVHKRTKTPISLLVMDLDDFKQVNDREGHAMGDQILIRVSQAILGRIRVTDSLFRYGGDEFVVLVANSDLETSSGLAEDLRALVEAEEAMCGSMITLSVGVAAYIDEQTAMQWFDSADEALFSAKRAGRNQVLVAR